MTRWAAWLALALLPFAVWLVLRAALAQRLGAIYRRNLAEPRRERLFLASVAFYFAFALIRSVTHAIRAGRGPFHDVTTGGVHVHHLVWGIMLLLGVGYLWLLQVGAGHPGRSAALSRLTAILYGIGAALTLDEFALWLRLHDVYWTREGRESVDAVMIFGALLSVGVWGGPFFRALVRTLVRREPRS